MQLGDQDQEERCVVGGYRERQMRYVLLAGMKPPFYTLLVRATPKFVQHVDA